MHILTAAGLLWTTNFLAWGDNCRELAAVVRTTTNGLQLRFIPSRRCRMCGLSNDWVKIGCLLDPWVFVPLSAPIICFYQRMVLWMCTHVCVERQRWSVSERVCEETERPSWWWGVGRGSEPGDRWQGGRYIVWTKWEHVLFTSGHTSTVCAIKVQGERARAVDVGGWQGWLQVNIPQQNTYIHPSAYPQ